MTLACTAASDGPTADGTAHAGAAATGGTATVRTDPAKDQQWHLQELEATAAWRISTGKGVTVAVIDSGVDASHPDLAGQVLPGLDLVEQGGNGHFDPVGHGTAVASLIAGRRDSRGVTGLAPDATILPVRVLDEGNRYDDALVVARAVRWAVDNGAQVINLSLGGVSESAVLASAIDYAFARDVVVVACTGNLTSSSPTEVWYPAREPGVVAVTGLGRDGDDFWPGALTGAETVLAAPATELLSARPGGYWRVQGTSFAAPMVSAAAALIRSRWPEMAAGEVVNRLISTARDLGRAGRDDTFGFGRVDPLAALTADVPKVGRNPLDDGSSPATVGFGPAPHLDSSPTPARPDNVIGGRASKVGVGWAARPSAKPTDERSGPGFWGWAALAGVPIVLVAVLVGGLVRRPGRAASPRREGRTHRGP